MSISEISATLVPKNTGVALSATAGILCSGNWKYALWPFPLSGGFVAQANHSKLGGEIDLKKASDGLVASADFIECKADIEISDLDMSGTGSGLPNLVKTWLVDILQTQLDSVACDQIKTLVNVNLTEALQKVNDDIRPYLKPPPPPSPPLVPPGMVDLTENTFVALLDYILDSVVSIDGPLGVNRVVKLLTNDTGEWHGTFEDFEYEMQLPAGNVTFGIDALELKGLDTWYRFDVLKPVQKYSLASATAMESLGISVLFHVNVSLANGVVKSATLFERGNLTAILKNTQLNTTLQLALNESMIFALAKQPTNFLKTNCLVNALHDVNATQAYFNMTVESLLLAAIGGDVEKQFDEAISVVLSLFTTAYAEILPAAFNGMIAGPLREYGNEWLANLTANTDHHCPYPEFLPSKILPTTGMVNFTDQPFFDVIQFANNVVGTTGPFGVNEVFQKITNFTGTLNIDPELEYNFTIPQVGNVLFGIPKISIGDLTSFSQFQMLFPTTPQNLSSSITIDDLDVTVEVLVQIQSYLFNNTLSVPLPLKLSIDKLTGSGDLQAALNESFIASILTNPQELTQIGCLIQSVFDFNLTSASLSCGPLEISLNPGGNVPPFKADDMTLIQVVINGVAQGPLKNFFNNWITEQFQEIAVNSTCVLSFVPPTDIIPEGMVSFNENSIVDFIDYALDDIVGADGPLGVNKILNMLTGGSGSLAFPLNTTFNIPIQEFANISFSLVDFKLGGLTTWETIDLLKPSDNPQLLLNNLDLGFFNFTIDYSIDISFFQSGNSLQQSGGLGLDLTKPSIGTGILILVNKSSLLDAISSPSEISLPCLLRPIHNAKINNLDLKQAILGLSVAVGNIDKDFGASFQEFLFPLLKSVLQGPVPELASDWIMSKVNTYQESCSPIPNPEPPIIDPVGTVNLVENRFFIFVESIFEEFLSSDELNRIVNLVTSNTGSLTTQLGFEYVKDFLLGDATIHLNSAVVNGLNTWNEFGPIMRESNHTLRTGIGIESLDLEIDFYLQLELHDGSPPWRENGTLVLNLQNTEISAVTLLGLNESEFDSFSSTSEKWVQTACILEPIGGLAILNSSFNILLKNFSISLAKKEFDFSEFGYGIAKLINSSFTGPLVNYLNDLINTTLAEKAECLPPLPPPPYLPDTVNLIQNPVMQVVDYLLNYVVGTTGPIGINKFLSDLTFGSGTLTMKDLPYFGLNKTEFPFSFQVRNTNVSIVVYNFSISGLKSWKEFQFFTPKDNQSLVSITELDLLDLDVSFTIQADPFGLGEEEQLGFYQDLTVGGTMEKNLLHAEMRLALNKSETQNVYDHFYQWLEIGCLVNAIEQIWFDELKINSSITELRYNSSILGNKVVNMSNYQRAINDYLYSFVNGAGRSYINDGIESTLYNTNHTCPPDDPNEPAESFNSLTSTISFSLFGFVFLCVMIASLLIKKHYSRPGLLLIDQDDEEEEDPSLLDPEQISHLPLIPSSGVFDEGGCLAFHSSIHWSVAWGLPLCLLLNIALFISSNTSIGASVVMRLTFGESETYLPSLFDFTLSNSIMDMWHAGVYPLSILIAVLSGCWPYMKLILMLFCWFVPVKNVSYKQRERILMFLDAFGKWSLIDAYVLVMMLTAFRFHLFTPTAPGEMDIFVIPGWGFYTFLIATIISLINTHILLHYHRASAPVSDDMDGPSGLDETQPLAKAKKPSLSKKYFKGKCGDKCSFTGPFLISLLLLLSVALITSGAILISFTFSFGGLAGAVLDFLHNSTTAAVTEYSLILVGEAIPPSVPNPNGVGIRLIQTTFFLFALAMPLLHLTVLIILWITPLSFKRQFQIFAMTEVFNAWSALDVFVVSILACLLEINQFAHFIIGDRCDLINSILKRYFNESIPGGECFSVNTSLESGCWMLFTAAVIYLVGGNLVMRVCHSGLEARQDKVEQMRNSVSDNQRESTIIQ